ncbi:hypothetical protein LCGC14_0801540 [marine sediment metagenome]|uniref:Uncharacterized protein n=1 Tax=marine sediment metagenome TaxID=412755 RepID=A0A0F9S9G3_9ZZZZ
MNLVWNLENVVFEPNTVMYAPDTKQIDKSGRNPDPFYQTINTILT